MHTKKVLDNGWKKYINQLHNRVSFRGGRGICPFMNPMCPLGICNIKK